MGALDAVWLAVAFFAGAFAIFVAPKDTRMLQAISAMMILVFI